MESSTKKMPVPSSTASKKAASDNMGEQKQMPGAEAPKPKMPPVADDIKVKVIPQPNTGKIMPQARMYKNDSTAEAGKKAMPLASMVKTGEAKKEMPSPGMDGHKTTTNGKAPATDMLKPASMQGNGQKAENKAPVVPLKIVPTVDHVAKGSVTPDVGTPPADLQNHGGPVIGSVEVAPVYWGAAWSSGTNATLATQLDGFYNFILTSSYIDMLAEYSTSSTPIGLGRKLSSTFITTEPGTVTASGRQVTDAQIQASLQSWITAGTVPATTANTLYFIYLPPDVAVLSFGEQSCAQFCGYHDHIGNIYYAVIPYVNCAGCVFPGDFLDTLTEVSSHELAEAITDPELNAWWDPTSGEEIGDICNRQTVRLGGYLVQTEWSNAQGICTINRPAASPWSGWASLGGWIDILEVAQNQDGRMEVFARGGDAAPWHIWQTAPSNGWSGWDSLAGWIDLISVGQNADGRLELFARGGDGAVWHKWQLWANGPWSGWDSLGGWIDILTVGKNADGRLELFARGSDGAVWHNWQVAPNGTWSGWASMGGWIDRLAVGQNADGRLELFARGSDAALWHMWQTAPSNGWSGWDSLGGWIDMIAVNSNADGRMEVFARGSDAALWHIWQTAPNSGWSNWDTLGGWIDMIAVGKNLDGRMEVFVRGSDSSVWHMWQTAPSNGWSGWDSLGGWIDRLAVSRNLDGRIEVFARGGDGGVWHIWQTAPNF